MTMILGSIIIPLLAAILAWQLVLHTLPRAVVHWLGKDFTMNASVPEQGPRGARGAVGATGKTGPQGPEGGLPRKLLAAVAVGFVMVMIIGGQAWLDQRENAERDRDRDAQVLADRQHDAAVEECIQQWADDFRDAVALARSFTVDLEDALEKRNEALDNIILVVIQGQASPDDPGIEAQFVKALQDFAQAKKHLDKVKAEVDELRHENPFPILSLACPAGEAAAEEVSP